jgi:hypothetical protein
MNLLFIFILFSALSLEQGNAAPTYILIHLHGLNKQVENGKVKIIQLPIPLSNIELVRNFWITLFKALPNWPPAN